VILRRALRIVQDDAILKRPFCIVPENVTLEFCIVPNNVILRCRRA